MSWKNNAASSKSVVKLLSDCQEAVDAKKKERLHSSAVGLT